MNVQSPHGGRPRIVAGCALALSLQALDSVFFPDVSIRIERVMTFKSRGLVFLYSNPDALSPKP